MIVMPAIDIRGGKVVRLKQGQLQEEKVYGSDPAEVARKWEAEGAGRLHVVDLDAAITGKPQFEVVADVISAVKIPVEVGGGLRVASGETFVLRVDVAWSPDANPLSGYLLAGHIF